MTFRLLEAIKEQARIWESMILGTNLEAAPNYTGICEPGRFYVGYCGELSFRDALWHYEKRWLYQAKPNGKPDDGSDMLVWINGRQRSLNIKTAGKPTHRQMMVPDKQFARHRCDFYIAARILGDTESIRFEGWLTHGDLAKVKPRMVKAMTRGVNFDELRPIRKLINALDAD